MKCNWAAFVFPLEDWDLLLIDDGNEAIEQHLFSRPKLMMEKVQIYYEFHMTAIEVAILSL